MFQKLELQERPVGSHFPIAIRILCAAGIAAVTAGLIVVVALAGKPATGLGSLVWSTLPASGVENPVTAVLLNFRSYDTLLEVAVLLVVATALLPGTSPAATTRFVINNPKVHVDPILAGLLRWLVPATIVMAGYMLWTGAYAPGGAFQAGALLAGAGVLISLAGRHQFEFDSSTALLLLTLGLSVFLAVGMAVAATTGTILQYPVAAAGQLILLVETAATLSIATILLQLFSSLTAVSRPA